VELPARPLVCLCPSCLAADPARAMLRQRNRLDLLRRLRAAGEDDRRDWERLAQEGRRRSGLPGGTERPQRLRRPARTPATTGRGPVRKGTMLNMIDDEGGEQLESYEETLERIAEYTGGGTDAEPLPAEDYRALLPHFGGDGTRNTV
jgi:hypothetical protein